MITVNEWVFGDDELKPIQGVLFGLQTLLIGQDVGLGRYLHVLHGGFSVHFVDRLELGHQPFGQQNIEIESSKLERKESHRNEQYQYEV